MNKLGASLVALAMAFLFLCFTYYLYIFIPERNDALEINKNQWGGSCPMAVYTIIDKDTGVYYAVTEKGGICVMETMDGKTKLVDQGDGRTIHPNKGVSND